MASSCRRVPSRTVWATPVRPMVSVDVQQGIYSDYRALKHVGTSCGTARQAGTDQMLFLHNQALATAPQDSKTGWD
jgi:hypothetical protein